MGISAKDFERMQARLKGSTASARPDAGHSLNLRRNEIILGIDPSLRGTGYGVIKIEGKTARCLAHGTIECEAEWEHSRCLLRITQELRRVVMEHAPTVCAIEGLFFANNLKTALVMGQARGAAMVAAAEGGLPIFEMAPRKVKQTIVGFGGAQKLAVAKMVQRMLNLAELPAPDAADALALALAHSQSNAMNGFLKRLPI
jgi:crossover junction endodeoxyribonuclease RuvC